MSRGDTKPMHDDAQLEARMAVFRTLRRRQVRRLAVVRAAWVLGAAALIGGALDVAFAPGAGVRVLFDAVIFGSAVAAAALAWRGQQAAAALDHRLARLLEEGDAGLDNAVVNALDFRERLAGSEPEVASRALMRRQIEEAAQRLAAASGEQSLRPPTLPRERRILAGVVAVAGVLLLLVPRMVETVAPRLLLPLGDYPPYCGTGFDVQPAQAEVEYGGSLDVTVRTTGRRPRSIALVVESRGKQAGVTELPLYESGQDTYLQTIGRVTEDLVFYARVPGGRSKQARVRVLKTPRIDTVRVVCRFPDYTHLKPVTRQLVDGLVKAYAGTRVTLQLTSNRELAGGQLTWGGHVIEFKSTPDPHTVEAGFTLSAAGPFTAMVRDTEGLVSKDKVSGRTELLPDEKPTVTIVAPPQESLATPHARVPINIEAGDDLGVSRVTLFRNLNGSADASKVLYEAPGVATFVNVMEVLDLGDLGVKPGDTIEYYVDATDSRPDPPQTASTPAGRLRIISDEDYAQMVQTMATAAQLREKYERLTQTLHDLAEAQAKLNGEVAALRQEADAGPLSESARRRLEAVAGRQEQLAHQTQEAKNRYASEAGAAPVYDVEKDYKKMLSSMAKSLNRAAGHMRSGREAMGKAAAEGAACAGSLASAAADQAQALKELGGEAAKLGEDIEGANREIDTMFALYADVETFKTLLGDQKELARKLHSYAGRTDLTAAERARMGELAGEQRRIRDALAALKGQLRAHADAAAAGHARAAADARAIADRIEELAIERSMEDGATALERPDADKGGRAAQAAYEAMLSMVKQCSGAQGEAESQCEERLRITMNVGLGSTFQQLGRGQGRGTGMGQGLAGTGRAGAGESASMPFGLYGASDMTGATAPKSAGLGRGKANATLAAGGQRQMATGAEEIGIKKNMDLNVTLPAGEQILEEYRPMILQYFRGMAEEAK